MQKIIASRKSCLLITDNRTDQIIFLAAMTVVSPRTLMLLAGNSKDAFKIVKKSPVIPECIFLDLRMPGAQGIDCLMKIKRAPTLQKVPIIAHVERAQYMTRSLKELGVSAIYSQPYKFDGVCNALYIFLNRYRYITFN